MCSAPADSGRAMQQDGRAYRDLVLAAVWQDGMALRYASEELQADREIVLAAVRQDGRALCFASEELQADHEIVLAAVRQVDVRPTTHLQSCRQTRVEQPGTWTLTLRETVGKTAVGKTTM